MRTSKKKTKSLKEELMELLDEDDNRRQMLLKLVEKAIGGDMKAFEAVREILNEKKNTEDAGLVIKLGTGMGEISQ